MNINYLNSLSEIENKYNVDLQDNEKVVFNAELTIFGTEKGSSLCHAGVIPKFTLTNKRMIADSGSGIWTSDILHDVVSCNKVEYGKWLFKSVYFLVTLNKEIIFDDGKQKLNGFQLYFNKEDTTKFEEIINNLFN